VAIIVRLAPISVRLENSLKSRSPVEVDTWKFCVTVVMLLSPFKLIACENPSMASDPLIVVRDAKGLRSVIEF